MGRLYNSLSMLYRFMIVGIFIFLVIQAKDTVGDVEVYHYGILLMYALIFSMFNFNKILSFVELILVLGYINIMDQPIFYYLLLMPIINFIGLSIKIYETVLVGTIIGGFVYLHTGQVWFGMVVFIATMMLLIIFKEKFRQVEGIEREIEKVKKKEYNYKKEIAEKNLELDNIMKMFVRSKELNEIKKEDDLLKAIIVSSKEFFDAEYSVLYVNENGRFEKIGDYGKVQQYDKGDILQEYEAESDRVTEGMIQSVMYLDGKKWAVIRVYGKTTKIMTNERRVKLGFSDVDLEVLMTYLDQALIKIKEIRLQKQTEFLAKYDYLTEIPNRRYFMERFDQFKVIADRKSGTFSLMILDVDHFKKFNDNYGHDVGDEVLKKVAKVVEEMVRERYDVVGRLGGEEFGIMLFNPEDKTKEIAERIRRRISRIEAVEQITVSIGIAYYGEDGTHWEDLYNNCDKALYEAKERGRNQVIEYGEI